MSHIQSVCLVVICVFKLTRTRRDRELYTARMRQYPASAAGRQTERSDAASDDEPCARFTRQIVDSLVMLKQLKKSHFIFWKSSTNCVNK